ncbi:D-alanyl-lipoteichoic acid acyltransferase DltB, MBOAT superfamily [Prevotella sp. khp7]|uniref:MBOAT family O-acyltransferase n=1 Tax=Prevotella sp. khp7 TaxID=1761885 RepID=UPI0008B64164|nr:MBOAT family O-acyltransferase [Prevotella sp. khp7]SEW24632.1 D-alanyl-lipoteichoic acid acyltransferase DltB, MBOAT superfamily [Prevotella sp. khp7]
MSDRGCHQAKRDTTVIFNSFNFIVMFPLIFLLYYAIPAKYGKARNMFLLFVGYLLYLQWKPVYALILLGVTAVTYYSALLIEKTKHPKRILTTGVLLTLLPLIFFKYFNFINDSISNALSVVGLNYHLQGLNWAIPIGISFFTFQALGYLWDVYYKRQGAERDFLTYALFVSFFPSILSGPINKASLVIPQLKSLRPYFDYYKAVEGLKMLLWGMFMKVVVADRVALYVDTVLPSYMNYTGTSCFVASLLYTIQIYADFAGYSMMAIGVGKVLGFELTENFRRPYFAVSVTDFWHRWHISLSTWLKDYVYIPMGGSHCSKLRNYWNIFVTFLVSGIWHGANWTFIIWGCMHGICQIIEKMLGQQNCNYGWLGKTIKIIVTFLIVNFAWIFFKMPTIGDAIGVIYHIFDLSQPMIVEIKSRHIFAFIVIGTSIMFIKDWFDEFAPSKLKLFNSKHICIRWIAYVFVMIMILLTGVFDAGQFIYANF